MLLYSLGNMVTVISDILRPELWSQNILQTENDTTFQTKHWCSAAQQATAERFVHLIDFGLLNELVEVSYNWGAYHLKIVQINEDEGKLALSSTKRNFLLTSLPLTTRPLSNSLSPPRFFNIFPPPPPPLPPYFYCSDQTMNTFLKFSKPIKKQNIHQSKTGLPTYKQHMNLS